ncbi:MAG: cobalamin transport system substrate-binding protein [Acidobacteriota bacterium]|jgi:ABC-type Fe3+-hydroxamate transport system substrate-binding protein|nr:cobalamin transport system substrate-binding protein [Acidobacteriota bacterium]
MTTATTRSLLTAAVARTAASAAVFFALACAGERPVATAKDDLGREVAVPPRLTRVVTLSPNLTEMIFAIGAGERIAGADDFSNFPVAARDLPKVGGMQPNIEKIVALRPDLVIASTEGNHPNLAPALAAANVPLFVVRTDRINQIPPAMTRLGKLFDVDTTRVVRDFEAALAAQKRVRPHPPRVMFAVWTDPLYVGGRETFTDDILQLTGATNAVQVTGWPQYSLESLLAAPPDLILYPRGAVTPEQLTALQQRVPELKAKIVAVDEDIFQRPGPRVVEAARRLNAILDAR